MAILDIEVAEPTLHKHVQFEQNFGLREMQVFDMLEVWSYFDLHQSESHRSRHHDEGESNPLA